MYLNAPLYQCHAFPIFSFKQKVNRTAQRSFIRIRCKLQKKWGPLTTKCMAGGSVAPSPPPPPPAPPAYISCKSLRLFNRFFKTNFRSDVFVRKKKYENLLLIRDISKNVHSRSGPNPGEGGGGELQKNWVGLCGLLSKTLTLFMTKICDIPYPIYDLTSKSKPCF